MKLCVSGLLMVFLVILVTGTLGGVRNWIAEDAAPRDIVKLARQVLDSILAAATVPLLLSIIGNEKTTRVFGVIRVFDADYQQALLILVGFCSLAAVFSQRFLDSLSKQIIRDLSQKVGQVEAQVEQTKLIAEAQVESDPIALPAVEAQEQARLELPTTQRSVLKALSVGQFLMRSPGGLCESTKLERSEVVAALAQLADRGLVRQLATSKGERWALTDEGRVAAAHV
jgi:hypothetical protein